MRPQAEPHRRVILNHLFAQFHLRQMCGRLDNALAFDITAKQRQGQGRAQRLGLP